MKNLPLKVRERLVALGTVLCLLLAVCGCGAARQVSTSYRTTPAPEATPTPDTQAVAPETPNYLSDLGRQYVWMVPVIRYRFAQPGVATDVYGAPLPARPWTDSQKDEARRDAVRAAFALWEAELAKGPAYAQRSFEEVGNGEPADIDVVVLPATSFKKDYLGWTTVALPQGTHEVHRAVVTIDDDLGLGRFAYVVLHELGHALMSTEHSNDAKTVMYFEVPGVPVKQALTVQDANTARAIYSKYSPR